jgi:PPK2 family polyphosphate:nucleotide phosphotransferase
VSRHPYLDPIDSGNKIRLKDFDPGDTRKVDMEDGAAELDKLGQEFAELGNLLTYAGKHALLVVLQGRDASGKDGAIRKVLEFSNIQNAYVHPFKVPTPEELSHDFLWRAHRVTPARGHIALFNRSHYEDVIAARVHQLVPARVWKGRFAQINDFERLLTASDVIIVKFFLHVSREEEVQRLLDREKDPRTAWKLNPGDWRELPLWDEVTEAYEDVLRRCGTPEAPWYLVPADKKWFRNLAILERLVLTLRPYRTGWLDALKELGKEATKEIRSIRERVTREVPGLLDGSKGHKHPRK